MNYDSLQSPNIDDIKDEFSRDYFEGKSPTLSQFVSRYPAFADELTEFVLKFSELTVVPAETQEPTELGQRAMERALSASKTKARTIAERMTEIGLTEPALVKELRAPIEMFALFHRTHVTAGAERFFRSVARVLRLTELQSRRMLAPQALAYRSKGSPKPSTRTFFELVEELHSKKLMSKGDFDFWMEGEDE